MFHRQVINQDKHSESFEIKEVSEVEVLEQLLSLKPNKAIGLDSVSATLEVWRSLTLLVRNKTIKSIHSFQEVSRDMEMLESDGLVPVGRPDKRRQLQTDLNTTNSQ